MNELTSLLPTDGEMLRRIVMRLRPYLQDSTLRRSRLDGVLASAGANEELRSAVDVALAQARIRVLEDRPHAGQAETAQSPAAAAVPAQLKRGDLPAAPTNNPSEPVLAGPGTHHLEPAASIAAARTRMESDRWVKQLAKVILTAQQECGLGLLIRADSGPLPSGAMALLDGERRCAAETLFLHNLGLVHSIARAHGCSGMDYDDVVSHGMVGLVRAVELFDPTAGCKFSTYATWWIRQAMTRGIANESRLIRVPVHVYERLLKVARTQAKLGADGSIPSAASVAAQCGLTVAQVEECRRLSSGIASLDCPIGDGTATLADVVDLRQDEPTEVLVHGVYPEDLLAALACLSEREADVITLRAGLVDEPQTLEEIGSKYGVTRERIRQIESKALTKLRGSPVMREAMLARAQQAWPS